MKFLNDIWDGLACIGLVTSIYLVWLGWLNLKKATSSARKSNKAFLAQTVAPSGVKPSDDIGVEVPWPTKSPH